MGLKYIIPKIMGDILTAMEESGLIRVPDPETMRKKNLREIRALAESMGIDQAGIDIRDICNSELRE